MFLSGFEINLDKFLIRAFASCFVFLSVACSSDPYLYDRTGFDDNARPVVAPNPSFSNSAAPDYYRQQQPYAYPSQAPHSQQGYPQQYPPQPIYPPQPYQGGGSRYYSNPYAMPPASPYYQRYDGDQYYVPPTYYNNIEQPQRSVGASGLNY